MTAISPANPDDLPLLSELEEQLFASDRISHRQFKYLLTKANSIVVKAGSVEICLGYMVLLKRKNCRNLRIYSIGVARHARRQGLALRFIKYAEQVARNRHYNRLTLEVCEHNESALKMYKSAGFVEYGKKTNYYEDSCNALLLHKILSLPESTK